MGLNIFFIVYRESFEAILILSIVWSILSKSNIEKIKTNKIITLGTLIGLIITGLVSIGLYKFQESMPPGFIDYFNFGILFISALLITQMCIWMAKNSKDLKNNLQNNINLALENSNFMGIISLIAFSIAREGIETVLFLSGAFLEASGKTVVNYSMFAVVGILASLVTLVIFLKGFKFFKQKYFFLVSTFFLLITASSFIVKLVQGLIMNGLLPSIKESVWDTSNFIDETSVIGGYFASMTGYQSNPALMTVIVYFIFWIMALFLYRRAIRNS
jgi:high-affinity iron transporter